MPLRTPSCARCRPLILALLAALATALAKCSFADQPADERVVLWPEQAPIGDGKFEKASSFITVHRPAPDKATGAAMVICPGGGYGGLVDGPEGHGIAKWLGDHGIAGVVLNYRLPAGRSAVPLSDAQRAIRIVRSARPSGISSPTGSASSASRPADTWLRRPKRITTRAMRTPPIRSNG